MKAVCILLVSFTLSHFHKFSSTFLQVLQQHNLSVGVVLNVRFTTDGILVKIHTHLYDFHILVRAPLRCDWKARAASARAVKSVSADIVKLLQHVSIVALWVYAIKREADD